MKKTDDKPKRFFFFTKQRAIAPPQPISSSNSQYSVQKPLTPGMNLRETKKADGPSKWRIFSLITRKDRQNFKNDYLLDQNEQEKRARLN